jgi:hypothetical protein
MPALTILHEPRRRAFAAPPRDGKHRSISECQAPTFCTRRHQRSLPDSCHARLHQQRLRLFCGYFLHVRENMRIDIECKGNPGVAQFLADDLWGEPRPTI